MGVNVVVQDGKLVVIVLRKTCAYHKLLLILSTLSSHISVASLHECSKFYHQTSNSNYWLWVVAKYLVTHSWQGFVLFRENSWWSTILKIVAYMQVRGNLPCSKLSWTGYSCSTTSVSSPTPATFSSNVNKENQTITIHFKQAWLKHHIKHRHTSVTINLSH